MTYIIQGNDPIYHHVPKAFEKGGLGEYDYRGKHYHMEKAPGTTRIVFMGDSFVYGLVEHNETIPFYFEQLVHERFPDKRVEVLNFGNVSYSPVIHEVQYHRLIKPLHADAIIYLYDTCDPIDDVIYDHLALYDESGVATAVRGEKFMNVGIRRSVFIRFLQFAYQTTKHGGRYIPQEEQLANRSLFIKNPYIFKPWMEFSFSVLDRLSGAIIKDGTKFSLYQYPWPFHLRDAHEFKLFFQGWGVLNGEWQTPEEHLFGKIVMEHCQEKGLICYDFAPEVRTMEEALGDGSRLRIYNNKDNHFTPFANLQFAKFILDKPATQELLSGK